MRTQTKFIITPYSNESSLIERLERLDNAYEEGWELLTTVNITDGNGGTYKLLDTLKRTVPAVIQQEVTRKLGVIGFNVN